MKYVSQRRVREVLDYDLETGIFVWRVDMGARARAGMVAGRISNGQRHIGIDGGQYNAGVLAWIYVNGKMPKNLIDHKNRKRDDNRFENLREATRGQNMFNRVPNANRKRRFTGVAFHPSSGKWNARLNVDKNNISLGLYHSEEIAALARDRAAIKYHGEFVHLNFPNAPKRDWIWLHGDR